MSLIQSARIDGHDPYAYLKDVLMRLMTGLLEKHPTCTVKSGRKLLSFEQDPDGVTARFEAPLAIEHYRADYLLGMVPTP